MKLFKQVGVSVLTVEFYNGELNGVSGVLWSPKKLVVLLRGAFLVLLDPIGAGPSSIH